MKNLKFLFLVMATVALTMFQVNSVKAAPPAFLFIFTGGVGAWAAMTYEECKEQGLGAEECAKKTWSERQPLDYSKLND